jgi:hypothetical protein
MNRCVVEEEKSTGPPVLARCVQGSAQLHQKVYERQGGVLALVQGEESFAFARNGGNYRSLGEPHRLGNQYAVLPENPSPFPGIRAAQEAFIDVEYLLPVAARLDALSGGDLPFEQILVRIILLPHNAEDTVSHSRILEEKPPQCGCGQADLVVDA